MEQNTRQQLMAGIFVTIGSLITLVSILFLGGERLLFGKQSVVFVDFEQVQGLSTGSVVSFAGINVGNVKSVRYNSSTQKIDVTLAVDDSALERMTEGTQAEIRTQGALGDKYIYLTPGDPTLPKLEAGSRIRSNEASGLIDVIAERGNEAEKVFEIITELHKVAKALNANNRSEELVQNLTDASRDLKAVANESRLLISQLNSSDSGTIRSSLQKLDRVLTKIDQGQGTLGALVNDPTVHNSIKNLLSPNQQRENALRSVIRNSIESND